MTKHELLFVYDSQILYREPVRCQGSRQKERAYRRTNSSSSTSAMATRLRRESQNEKRTVQFSRFEHAFIAALGLGTYRLMRDSDIVTVELDEEQRELIAGELRNFMGELTRKIVG